MHFGFFSGKFGEIWAKIFRTPKTLPAPLPIAGSIRTLLRCTSRGDWRKLFHWGIFHKLHEQGEFHQIKKFWVNDSAAFQTSLCLLADLKTNRHLCCFIHSLFRFPLVGKKIHLSVINASHGSYTLTQFSFFPSDLPALKWAKWAPCYRSSKTVFLGACRHYRSYYSLLFPLFWQRRSVIRSPV